ncbi:uncharacterized protein LOC125500066 [Athalia rosae]|uniref:uncharacterized protein LOC125500066 n=1 Tax=Athalia rosae TaxID=37344 RepID=UPI0020336AB5|nr:uncharacterized protein LOC125500066 [Athalia rosae]XP_048507245.1 uncharacterized protein LOC125500066 [Athalia rosae]
MESKFIILVVIAVLLRNSFAGVVGTTDRSVGTDDKSSANQNSRTRTNLRECREAFRATGEAVFDYIAGLLPNSSYTPTRDPEIKKSIKQNILKGIAAYSNELLAISPESSKDVSSSQPDLIELVNLWLSALDAGTSNALKANDPDFPAHIADMKDDMSAEINTWFSSANSMIAIAARARAGGSITSVIRQIERVRNHSLKAANNTVTFSNEIAAAIEILHEQVSDSPDDQDKFYLDRYNAIRRKEVTATDAYVATATNLFDLLKVLEDIPLVQRLQIVDTLISP